MGVIGVLAEPYKGAKKNGFKGGVKGIGKGIVGLITKPVGGTIMLFTKTARGINNTPGTLYKGLTKKKKNKQEEEKRKYQLRTTKEIPDSFN